SNPPQVASERLLADVLHETVDDETALVLEPARPLGDLELQAATERQVDVEADDLGIATDAVNESRGNVAERVDFNAVRQIAEHTCEQGIPRLGPLQHDGSLTHAAPSGSN